MVKSIIQKKLYIPVVILFFSIIGIIYFYSQTDTKCFAFSQAITETSPDYPDSSSFQLSLEEQKASATKYDKLIRAACKKYSLDPALVKAVIHAESRFDPWAVSPKGAVGLMQLDPITVEELGIKDPFNPKHNIYGGVRYLRGLLDTFEGDKNLALAAYNAGPNRVHRHKGIPPFKETKKYLAKVFRYLGYYKQVLVATNFG